MPLWDENDVGAVIPVLRALLAHPTVEVKPHECLVHGKLRGLEVRVRCWERVESTGWVVVHGRPSPPAFPLLLSAWRTTRGRRDPAVASGDAGFDAAWLVEAAPARTARELLDVAVVSAMRQVRRTRGPGLLAVVGARDVPALAIDADDVRVTGSGEFAAAEVAAGVELAVAVGERLAAIAGARQSAPALPGTAAADEAEVAKLRATWRPIWERRRPR